MTSEPRSTDIVDRLVALVTCGCDDDKASRIGSEAAAEITRLRSELEAAREETRLAWSSDEHQAVWQDMRREIERLNRELEASRERNLVANYRADDLHADLERLKSYLTRIACLSQDTDLLWWQVQARQALADAEGRSE